MLELESGVRVVGEGFVLVLGRRVSDSKSARGECRREREEEGQTMTKMPSKPRMVTDGGAAMMRSM